MRNQFNNKQRDFYNRLDRYDNLDSLKVNNLSRKLDYRDYEIFIERIAGNNNIEDGIYVFIKKPANKLKSFYGEYNKTESFKFIEMEVKDYIDMELSSEMEKDL